MDAPYLPMRRFIRLNYSTIKTLAGSLLVGLISGFFDVVGGFNAYVVQDAYGIYLLLARCV